MCKSIVWGYARISTMKQRLERQIDNIRREYPEVVIITEEYTGTTTDRPKWNKLVEQVRKEAAKDLMKSAECQETPRYMMKLAERQIEIAFQTAQAEVDYLHQRTSEGVRKAQAAGKQVGRAKGSTVETKKSIEAKKQIQKHSRDFNGALSDVDCIKLIGIARNTYFKYKRELRAEQ